MLKTCMQPPQVKVLEADEAKKRQIAYEMAMFLYGIYKNRQKDV